MIFNVFIGIYVSFSLLTLFGSFWLSSAQELQTAERVAGAEAALAVAAAALRRWEAHLGDRELQHCSCHCQSCIPKSY